MRLGDLISREALKKAIDDYAEKRQDTLLWQADIEELINNAPTVEPEITEEQAIDKLHETGWLPLHDKEMTERPQGDLISREALLKRVDEERKYLIARGQTGAEHILVHNFRDLIDNAPTVEAIPTELHEKIMDKVEGDLLECQSHLRPQGEWITHQTGMLLWEECNQCHAQVGTVGMNFCPNCGADMRGKEE